MQNFIMPMHCNTVSIRKIENLESIDIEGKRVFLRTKYLILTDGKKWKVLEVYLKRTIGLMRPVKDVRVISEPEETQFVNAPEIDVMNPCSMLTEAIHYGKTLVVRGKWGLYSFIKITGNVRKIMVVDVVPPCPPRIESLILDNYHASNISPFAIVRKYIDLNEIDIDGDVILPCPVEGYSSNKKIYYVSQKMPNTNDVTVIGCRLTRKIVGKKYDFISICPLDFAKEIKSNLPIITRCCEVMNGIKRDGNIYCVQYGCTSKDIISVLKDIETKFYD